MSDDRNSLNKLKAALADNAEALAVERLGKPTSRRGYAWRWGRNSSLSVYVKGARRGSWRSFEAEQGGSLLDLYAFTAGKPVPARGNNLKDAIAWAKGWLGWGDDSGYRQRVHKPLPPRPPVFDVDDYETRRQALARKKFSEAIPLPGTLGERHLASREIKPDAWPESVRWHERHYEVIFAKVSPDGSSVTQIQSICLKDDGTNIYWPAEPGKKRRKKKPTTGPGYGGACRFPGDQRALCLAEGPETALSIWHATGIETWCAFGQVTSISLEHVPRDRTIVVCHDDDPRNAQSRKALRDAIRVWRREGRTVVEALPWDRTKRDKSDFNDALRADGLEAVRRRIERTLAMPETVGKAEPIQWARKRLADAMQETLGDLWDRREDMPALAIRVVTGGGKTRQALEGIRDWIAKGRGPVVFAVPDHNLGDGVLQRALDDAGISRVAVWRGREAINPATGSAMCGDLEAVKAVQRMGGKAQFIVCHNGKSGTEEQKCPLYDLCAYQGQRMQDADLWIVPHALLFAGKPESIPQPSLLVIDEDAHRAGLVGTDTREPVLVTRDELDRRPLVPHRGPDAQGWNDDASAELVDELEPLRRKLLTAFDAAPLGYLARQALLDAGLTAEECARAAELEWKRWREPPLWPGMSPKSRKAALESADSSGRDVPRLARLWRILAALLADDRPSTSGGIEAVERKDKDTGASYRAFRLQWREAIAEGFQAPTLLMSATLRLDLVKPYFPGVKLAANIDAAAPHQRVTYWHGKSFSHSNLHALAVQKGQELPKAAEKLRRQLWAQAMALHRQNGGETLLIVPKAVEEWLRAEYAPLPAGIHLAHHGAIAGRDEWRNVRTLIVVGRTLPPADAVERMASALTGAHVKPETVEGGFPATMGTLTDKTGRAASVEMETAGSGIAEAVRASIAEDGLIQAIGRGRGVNRTADDPLDVHLIGSAMVEGLPIDDLAEWTWLGKEAETVALQGVWLANAADMASVVGVSPNALQVARRKQKQKESVSYKGSLYETDSFWSGVRYRRKIERHGWQEARFAPGAVDDPKAWLEARLGPVEIKALPMEAANDAMAMSTELLAIDRAVAVDEAWIDEATALEPIEHCRRELPELPPDWRARLVLVQRSQGWSQEELASRLDLARPTLANALGGRYALGCEAAERLLAMLERPPPIRQMTLLL
jgi:putative DNA primase/helicase